jgi:cytochrome c oxidase subunit 2
MPYAQATGLGEAVDKVFLFTFAVSVAVLVLVTSLIVYFVFRYSRARNPKPTDIEGNLPLEIGWTVATLAIFLVMFYFGWTEFVKMRNPPRDAMVVQVTARQWAWSFEYPNGRRSDELYLALDRPVKLELRSQDVLHGFYIAPFRVKSDVVPGKVNYLWFTPSLLGAFDIQCTVICGANHSYMLSKVHVVPEEEFRAWYFRDEDAPEPAEATAVAAAEPVDPGCLALLDEKECLACHSVDGTDGVGPTLAGLYGASTVVRTEGEERQLTVDDQQIRLAIGHPEADTVKGFPSDMPATPMTDAELDRLVECLESLG